MVLYESNSQVIANAMVDELIHIGYMVRTCQDAGGHHIASEYVRVLLS